MVTSNGPTKPVYQHDGQLCILDTRVISCEPISTFSEIDRALFKSAKDEDLIVQTAETIFYAQGGGQPSDVGIMTLPASTTFNVTSVRNASEGRILHCGHFSAASPSSEIGNSVEVKQSIDVELRRLHSRIHTAGHVLGLAMRSLVSDGTIPLLNGLSGLEEGKAQHYPNSAWVECRVDPAVNLAQYKDAIQARTTELVERDLPVKICFWSFKEAVGKCAVSPAELGMGEGDTVRAVDIEGAGGDDGLNAYPCGGTHVGSTRECGEIRVRNIKKKKGITNVSYEVI